MTVRRRRRWRRWRRWRNSGALYSLASGQSREQGLYMCRPRFLPYQASSFLIIAKCTEVEEEEEEEEEEKWSSPLKLDRVPVDS